jgi:hypothetical protein
LQSANGPARAILLRAAGQIGGPQVLAALATARTSPDADVRNAAIRALADSPDIGAAAILLEIVRDAAADPVHKVLALRGYIRLADGMSRESALQLSMYRTALELAGPAERKLALAGLGRAISVESMKLAAVYVADPQTREEAGMAAATIAQFLARQPDNAPEIRAAMEKVLAASPSERVNQIVQRVLGRL